MVKSLLTVASCLLLLVTAAPQDDAAMELTGLKCVVRGKPLKSKDHKVRYKDGEVYLCCEQCAKEFSANTEEFATKANHQLVATGQYVQKACPVSGESVSDGFSTRIAAVEVGLHCQDCVEQMSNISIPKHIFIFGEDNFGLSFVSKAMAGKAKPEEAALGSEIPDSATPGKIDNDQSAVAKAKPRKIDMSTVKCLIADNKNIVEVSGVDYLEGKVYFCCESCQDEFRANPAKYAQRANQQLVETGQYIQKACPFSGKDVDPELSLEIDGLSIGVSSSNYLDIVKSAADDDVRAELVFNPESFEMGFKKK